MHRIEFYKPPQFNSDINKIFCLKLFSKNAKSYKTLLDNGLKSALFQISWTIWLYYFTVISGIEGIIIHKRVQINTWHQGSPQWMLAPDDTFCFH